MCKAFRARGHNAFSCDIQECSGGHPEWHIKDDVIPYLNGVVWFHTQDGERHTMCAKWDLIIAHPPCTYLTVTGNRWLNVARYGDYARKRLANRENAAEFFMQIVNAKCERIAVENPIGYMSTHYRKPNQIIQPWQFALSAEENTVKSTCLWLKGLPKLKPLHTEQPPIEYVEWYDERAGRTKRQSKWYYETRCASPKDRARLASKTFPGIAHAMAEQWG